jgi:hypothetical protein
VGVVEPPPPPHDGNASNESVTETAAEAALMFMGTNLL